ncbi:hypothetical protein L1I30_03210 [Gillisia sp. M10.2A]|uniref:Protein involved in gliding motility SprE n=1 Tax=Gillisia lutea TaxID=2909668 RepID=A0ABS9ECT2_9FLAO|nr:hypothetical protein [Gillisia lutea]MCF4100667.1 hypothetical protein [Gillisia lutea]
MNKLTLGSFCLISVILLSGCSRKKDSFINRNWHAVSTEYNTLYNGNLALEQGKEQIAATYNENFWDILPVERMQVSEEILLPGTNRNEFFKIAEEKATKAIQKHSMLISGKEKNPQIDEAYLLLGKARYYDQRFIPALEAFNYILHKYPASNTINHAQIWREKTNIRLQNNKLAIKNLKRILKAETLKDQDRADAKAMISQAYINLNALDSAVVPIRTAANYTSNNEEKGRYHFIEGQLYERLGKRDSANLAFNKVVELNRKSPREYMINAQLNKAGNFSFATQDHLMLRDKLEELANNRENRPFLDRIYFQQGEYYNYLDSIDQAISNYNKSLKEPSTDSYLQSVSYESLGNIYFDKANYRKASAYFDSTLTKIPTNTRDFFIINRKKNNLQEVILYEEIAEENDSILKFVAMDEEARLAYFTSFTNNLKDQAIAEAKKGVIPGNTQETLINRNTPGPPPGIGGPGSGNSFYFYNPVRVANGLQEFLRNWGPRELQDNWRLATGNFKLDSGAQELDEVSTLIIENSPEFDPQTYISDIPSDANLIDSLTNLRNDAYFRLGVIYKDKFKEDQLAAERLEALLGFTNEERLVIPANYYLYQIYTENDNAAEAQKYRQTLVSNYPDSRYTANILHPGQALTQEDQADKFYKDLYRLFEDGNYAEVIVQSEEYMSKFKEDALLPKIALLKATATGRLNGFEAYKKNLSQLVVDYPQTEEANKAQQLIETALPKLENKEFNISGIANNLKLLYEFEMSERENADALKLKIDQAILDLGYTNYDTSIDVYNAKHIFVMVHGMKNLSDAQGFAELLNINKKYKLQHEPVIISSDNYRIIQLHKNLEGYKLLIDKNQL